MKKASAQQQGPITIIWHTHRQIKLLINNGINTNIIGRLYWQNSPSLLLFLTFVQIRWRTAWVLTHKYVAKVPVKNASKRMFPSSTGSARWSQIHTHIGRTRCQWCGYGNSSCQAMAQPWPAVSDEEWSRSPICLSGASQEPVSAQTTPDWRVSGHLAKSTVRSSSHFVLVVSIIAF